MDSDGDKVLSFREFALLIFCLTNASKQTKLVHIFSLFDEDNSQTLSFKEVKTIMKFSFNVRGLREDSSKAKTIFGIMDKDGSGQVSVKEFTEACAADEDIGKMFEELFDPLVAYAEN